MTSKKLFIHIPKNAGLTIRHYLKDKIVVCGKHDFTSNYSQRLTSTMNKFNEHPGYEHARWRDVGPQLQQLKSFAVIRNPWMKVGSRFIYGLRNMERGRLSTNYMANTFDEFLEERHKYANNEFYWHRAIHGWYPQLDHVTDRQEKIRCDILRFEQFNKDIGEYFNLTQPIKSRNAFHRGNKDPQWAKWDIDYKTLYNDKTIQIIADWYKVDIDTFGFDFDTTATRNTWKI